jgi:hypothetical protein
VGTKSGESWRFAGAITPPSGTPEASTAIEHLMPSGGRHGSPGVSSPYEDGYLQLELRCYVRRDGSARERGPYWYFQIHEGGKRRKLYLGKTSDPESSLAAKRVKPSGE